MTPQSATVLSHLKSAGSITRNEALTVHRCANVAFNIHELRGLGYRINSAFKKDVTGRRYVRYVMAPIPSRILP